MDFPLYVAVSIAIMKSKILKHIHKYFHKMHAILFSCKLQLSRHP